MFVCRVEVPMEHFIHPMLEPKEENDVDVPLPTDQVSFLSICYKMVFRICFFFPEWKVCFLSQKEEKIWRTWEQNLVHLCFRMNTQQCGHGLATSARVGFARKLRSWTTWWLIRTTDLTRATCVACATWGNATSWIISKCMPLCRTTLTRKTSVSVVGPMNHQQSTQTPVSFSFNFVFRSWNFPFKSKMHFQRTC